MKDEMDKAWGKIETKVLDGKLDVDGRIMLK